MTILTIEIYRTGRPAKIVLQMHGVIELDSPGIAASQSQRGELRMVAVKARHGMREMGGGAGGVQVGMALRATGIRSCGQPQMPAMFFMARRAIRGEELIGVMDRPVVARLTALIAGLGAEHSSPLDVTGVAFGGEDRVRGRNSSAAVHVIVARKRIPTEPENCRQWGGYGQNKAQAPEGMGALEIAEVDALREFFGGELGSSHDDSLLFFNIARP
jgi:hypothetical protein